MGSSFGQEAMRSRPLDLRWRRGTAERAIGTHAEEQIARDAVGLIEKCAAALLAVVERQWTLLKFLADLLQLLGSLVGRRRSTLDALVRAWAEKPTAGAPRLLLGACRRRSAWDDG
jgi:hypothetical protein